MKKKSDKKVGDVGARVKRKMIGVPVSPELRDRIDIARRFQSGKSAAQFVREAIDAKLEGIEAAMEVG